jgi:multidrug efflux pump subunit AcrA (membrane-fusion protein)
MKRRLIIALVVVVAAVGIVFGLTRFRSKGKAQDPGVIATGMVTRGDIRLTVEGWGTLSAGEVKEVAPLTEGLVDRVLIKEGQEVQEGDALLTLFNATLGMEVEKARLELDQARLELAKILGVPPEQVDAADPDLALSVRAPVAGRVVELKVKDGDQIGAKQDLLRLVDDSQVLVDVFLDEGSAKSVKPGQSVELMFHDFSGSTSGTVKEVDPNRYPDGSSFTRRAVIAVPNPGLLTPEMKAEVNINIGAGIVAGTGTATKWKEDTWVSSGVGGRIERLQVKEGSRVNAGQVIASMEKSSALLDVYGNILALRQAQVAYERKQEELGIPHFINRELYQSASEVRELTIDANACPIDREDLITFVTNSIHTHPYVTFNKTVSIYSKVRQVDEVAVRKALAALIDEGIFVQLIEHTPQSDVRVLRTPDSEEAIA